MPKTKILKDLARMVSIQTEGKIEHVPEDAITPWDFYAASILRGLAGNPLKAKLDVPILVNEAFEMADEAMRQREARRSVHTVVFAFTKKGGKWRGKKAKR